MRRAVAIVALLLPLLGAEPAAAHVCTVPGQVDVGEPATVTVGVGAEASAVTGVEVGVPDGFRVTGASGDGWQADVQGDVVRFDGNTLRPFSCGYVTIEGVAEVRAPLAFPLTLTTADGGRVTYDAGEPYREDSAQFVYAGVEPPGPPGGGGSGVVGAVSAVLLGVGSVVVIVLLVAWLRTWRSADP